MLFDFDCSKCDVWMKTVRGCNGDALETAVLDGENLTTCIRRPIFDNPELFSVLFRTFKNYKDGHLPEVGGIMDQSNYFIEAVEVISNSVADCEEELRKRSEAKAAAARKRK